jgi:hypothetical protein
MPHVEPWVQRISEDRVGTSLKEMTEWRADKGSREDGLRNESLIEVSLTARPGL